MHPDLFSLTPERLVVHGFRHIMAAQDLNDAACLERAWCDYIAAIGPGPTRRLMGELQYWTRVIRSRAERPMRYFPCACRHICHDECMAVAMVAAAQGNDRACTELAASRLLSTDDSHALTDLWMASSHFATALKLERLELFPVSAEIVTSIATMEDRNLARTAAGSMH
jgi:hypothetical protein